MPPQFCVVVLFETADTTNSAIKMQSYCRLQECSLVSPALRLRAYSFKPYMLINGDGRTHTWPAISKLKICRPSEEAKLVDRPFFSGGFRLDVIQFRATGFSVRFREGFGLKVWWFGCSLVRLSVHGWQTWILLLISNTNFGF